MAALATNPAGLSDFKTAFTLNLNLKNLTFRLNTKYYYNEIYQNRQNVSKI